MELGNYKIEISKVNKRHYHPLFNNNYKRYYKFFIAFALVAIAYVVALNTHPKKMVMNGETVAYLLTVLIYNWIVFNITWKLTKWYALCEMDKVITAIVLGLSCMASIGLGSYFTFINKTEHLGLCMFSGIVGGLALFLHLGVNVDLRDLTPEARYLIYRRFWRE